MRQRVWGEVGWWWALGFALLLAEPSAVSGNWLIGKGQSLLGSARPLPMPEHQQKENNVLCGVWMPRGKILDRVQKIRVSVTASISSMNGCAWGWGQSLGSAHQAGPPLGFAL